MTHSFCHRLIQKTKDVFSGACLCERSYTSVSKTETRDKIFCAGRAVFAEKGFSATVRDICSAAGVNGAAVNYHFGSKDGLLAEILKDKLDRRLHQFPIDGGIEDEAPTEAKVFACLYSFLCCCLLPDDSEEDARIGELVSDAFFKPIEAFERYAEAHRQEVRNTLLPLVAELVRERNPEDSVCDEDIENLYHYSISPVLFYYVYFELVMQQRENRPFSVDEVGELADQLTGFVLGGLKHGREYLCGVKNV